MNQTPQIAIISKSCDLKYMVAAVLDECQDEEAIHDEFVVFRLWEWPVRQSRDGNALGWYSYL